MICTPRVAVICDRCQRCEVDFELCELGRGAWDLRNIDGDLEAEGWLVANDEQVCPDCVEEMRGGEDE